MKTFADNIIKVTQNLEFFMEMIKKIVGKGENAGYQHFLLFPLCLHMLPFSILFKVRIVW